jgi:hypothetical protein
VVPSQTIGKGRSQPGLFPTRKTKTTREREAFQVTQGPSPNPGVDLGAMSGAVLPSQVKVIAVDWM